MTIQPSDEFIKEVEKHAKGMSRFYRLDLHVHSPDSFDFPRTDARVGYAKKVPHEDQDPDPEKKKETFKDSLVKSTAKIDVVAITDHNRCGFAAELSRTVKSPITFPGIEVTIKTTPEFTTHKVHLLCVFPQGAPETDIESIFPTSNRLPSIDKRDENTVFEGNVQDLIKNVHNLKGIVIAAHVNSGSGLRKIFLEYETERLGVIREIRKLEDLDTKTAEDKAKIKELKEKHDAVDDDVQKRYLSFLDNHSIDAVQISRSDEAKFYGQHHVALLGLNPFPCLLSSDSHNSADIGVVGGRTFVKLQTLSLEGLKSAFKDPGARIRYDTDEVPPQTAHIEGIGVEDGFLGGSTVAFSENLSCLIGGRGSGKSALIEALRFVFGATIPEEVKTSVRKMHDFVLKDSTIKVLFKTKDGERFILKCSRASNGDPVFECWDTKGNLCPEITQWSDRLQIDLYGWSEIEKLSYDMPGQRALVDSAIPEAESMQKDIDEKLTELEVNRTSIVTHVRTHNTLVPKVRKLEEALETKKRILKELRPQLKKKQENQMSRIEKNVEKLQTKTDSLEETLEEYRSALTAIREIQLSPLKKTLTDKLSEATRKKLKEAFEAGKTSVQEAEKHLTRAFAILEREHVALSEQIRKEQEILEGLQTDPAYQTCIELLRSKSQADAEIRKYRPFAAQMRASEKALNSALGERNALETELESKQLSLYEKRREVVAKINTDLVQINEKLKTHKVALEVGLEKLTDRTKLTTYLTAEMKNVGVWYKAQQHPQLLAEKFSPSELSTVLWHGDDKGLATATSLSAEQSKKLIEHFQREQEDGTWSEKNVDRVLKISEEIYNDKPIIKYNSRPLIDGLSPGQRCTALLPLIFLRTTLTPLIIDQPEDNLDSQLVFELVVDMLRGLKERRQVIIATHNPNIPVSGDAEQVAVLVADSGKKTSVVHQGSIDDPVITERIKALLEGGEEAFKIRSRKYGLLK